MQSHQKTGLFIHLSLLAGLTAVAILIAAMYVSSEQYIYFWDYSNYSDRTFYLTSIFNDKPLKFIRIILASFKDEYNYLPCLPLLPFTLIFGYSRLVYILSCVIVYCIPFALVMGAIATQLIPMRPPAVFWSTAFLTLLVPCTWMSTLRGLPDMGGAMLIALAIWVYLQNLQLKQRYQILWLAGLLALAILFRRHFAYGVRAFLIAIALQAILMHGDTLKSYPRRAANALVKLGIRLSLLSIGVLILSPFLIYQVLKYNYRVLYASYELSTTAVFEYFGSAYGWILWLMAALGFALGLRDRTAVRPSTQFIVIFGGLSLVQWLLFSKQQGVHYTLHFLFFMILGLAILFWTSWITLAQSNRTLVLITSLLFLCINLGLALTPIGQFQSPVRSWFSLNIPPLVREDYPEFTAMVDYLRKIAPDQEPIYVAASSGVINNRAIGAAEAQQYGWENTQLELIDSPDIDSRDHYPLEGLLQAQYVIVPSRFQYHLDPQEQDVVKVAFEIFAKNLTFSQAFKRLDQQFKLEGDVDILIYKRIRPTGIQTILQTLRTIQSNVEPKPAHQSDWIVLSNQDPNSTEQHNNLSNTPLSPTVPIRSFLYFGPSSQLTSAQGTITLSDQNCKHLSLQLSTLDSQGEVLDVVEQPVRVLTKQKVEFSLPLPKPASAYLRLDISGKPSSNCLVELEELGMQS